MNGRWITTLTDAALLADAPRSWLGVAAFCGLFLTIIFCLLLLPQSFLGDTEPRPWWRNTRFWAIVVAAAQVAVYLRWG